MGVEKYREIFSGRRMIAVAGIRSVSVGALERFPPGRPQFVRGIANDAVDSRNIIPAPCIVRLSDFRRRSPKVIAFDRHRKAGTLYRFFEKGIQYPFPNQIVYRTIASSELFECDLRGGDCMQRPLSGAVTTRIMMGI